MSTAKPFAIFHKGATGAGAGPTYGNFTTFATSNVVHARDILFASPFVVPVSCTIDRLSFSVQTVGGAGSVARIGIYDNTDHNTLYPDQLIIDGGEFDAAVGATLKTTTVSQFLDSGIYWFAYTCGSGVGPTIHSVTSANCNPMMGVNASLVLQTGISVARTYAALPQTFTAGAAYITAAPPLGLVRVAS